MHPAARDRSFRTAPPRPALPGARCEAKKKGRQGRGPQPGVIEIEDLTRRNDHFRTALWTGGDLRVAATSIEPGGDVGLEVHGDRDRFPRVEAGRARVEMGPTRDDLDFAHRAGDGSAVLVPAGTWHGIVNVGEVPLKPYSVHAPAEHPHGTAHRAPRDDPGRGEQTGAGPGRAPAPVRDGTRAPAPRGRQGVRARRISDGVII